MMGKGKSVGHSQTGTCSARKTLRRCNNNVEADNIILIDLDSDNFADVIIIDVPESLKLRGSSVLRKGKQCSLRTVICIDDEEDSGDDNPGKDRESDGDISIDSSSSRRFCPTSDNAQNLADGDLDEHQFVRNNTPPVKLTKCKRTYSGKASSRSCYCLDDESDNGLPDGANSDSELMEDFSGKLHKQWEKANLKKKHDPRSGYSGRGTTSGPTDGLAKVEAETMKDQYREASFSYNPGNASHLEEKGYPVVQTGCSNSRGTFQDSGKKNFCDTKGSVPNEKFSSPSTQYSVETEANHISENFQPESLGQPGANAENGFSQKQVEPALEEQSFSEVRTEPCNIAAGEPSGELVSNNQQEVETVTSQLSQGGNAASCVESTIINEREKLKETDEYKRAAEEEWASRQRELQIQAEEAQMQRRLRKRIKAESMRLLDMERRQKQRLEEMRETQKKDEENLNLKEKLRAEVRNELNHLELTCRDMASLLRSLGIHVDGGLHPLPNDVRAAYKRALLSFHPDRASGSDVRQLVEAEEKFKLISRMKEKFTQTS